jgi:hypothetical protein
MGNEHTCPMLTPGDGLPCKWYLRPDDKTQPGFCGYPGTIRFFCEEAMKRRLPSISSSSLTDFIHCKLRYYHKTIEGLSVKPEHLPESMKLGKAWDLILHAKYAPTFDPTEEVEALQLTPEQAAKINGLARAFTDLEIHLNTDGLLGCQYKITSQILNTNLVGFVDRAYENFLVESKLSTRPNFYEHKENVTYQAGTYMIADGRWDYIIMEVTRTPSLRIKDGESPEDYEERIYGDVVSRPGYYFLGWDRKAKTFGTRFWRGEFDLEEVYSTYVYVLEEIKSALERGAWYPNSLACHVPSACAYLPIKRSGVVSEEIYERRQKGG